MEKLGHWTVSHNSKKKKKKKSTVEVTLSSSYNECIWQNDYTSFLEWLYILLSHPVVISQS